MRVALVNIYSEPFAVKQTGGLITSAVKLARENKEFVPVSFGRRKKSHAAGWEYLDSVKDLSGFDFAILSSFGTVANSGAVKQAADAIHEIGIPFAVQSHAEHDEQKFDHSALTSHPLFRLWLPIAEDLYGSEPVEPSRKFVFPAHESCIKNEGPRRKEKIVAATSRLTTTKRISELADLSVPLQREGFRTVSFASPEGSYFYRRSIEEKSHRLEWGEGFSHEDVYKLLGPVMYHWNCRYFARKRMAPRLELATIEALQSGCIPIVHGPSTPKEYHNSMIAEDIRKGVGSVFEKIREREGDVSGAIETFNDAHAGKNQKLLSKIRESI